jgi:hypothetical protein
MDIIVPQHQHQDQRLQRPLQQLCEELLGRTLIAMVTAAIGPECERQLLLTVLPNHRDIDIDLRQTLDAAKLGESSILWGLGSVSLRLLGGKISPKLV